MANDLTGEFDVVAEFSIPAVNRLLAAMHRAERFLHWMSIYVNDTHHPVHPKGDIFSILGAVDAFGEPIVDHTKIGTLIPVSGQLAATDPIFRVLDPVVNPELIGTTIGPIVPSYLKGRAQLQLSPPTIDVADASGSNVTVTMQVMARYLPDRDTSPLREFVRGQLQITAPLSQVASQRANVIDVNLKVDNVKIDFTPAPSTPLSAEDLAGITLLIRNALKTSFLPSNATVPPNIDYVQFKTLVGNPNAIGLMLNMAYLNPVTHLYEQPQEEPGDPASMNNNFLDAGDDFAFAVSADFILGKIQFQPIANRSVPCYNLAFQLPTVEFQAGRIVLTVKGHAEGRHWWCPPAFNFTATQAFTLQLVSTTGGALNTAELAPEGDVSVAPFYIGWLVDLFQKGDIQKQREDNLRDMQPQVRDMMDVERNVGRFLNSLLKPAEQTSGTEPQEDLKPILAYTSVEIQPSGIALHGSLAVPDWPPLHVEFEQIPATTGTGPAAQVPQGPDYSALKTWIPGGVIHQYEWRYGAAPPFLIDPNKFVYRASEPGTVTTAVAARTTSSVAAPPTGGTTSTGFVSGYAPLCLTVRGTQLSASGPVVEQPVNASVCEYSSFPIVNSITVALSRELPLVALTQPGPGGLVQVTGHASAQPGGAGKDTPNLVVHFANEQTAGHLDFLTQALRESRSENAPAVILAVLPTNQLARARYTEGVIYAEEQGGAWERVFRVKRARRPQAVTSGGSLTLIVGPKGDTLWQHEGELDSGTLAAALHRVLVKSGPVRPGMLRLSLRIGRKAPDFLIDNVLTLRKLEGRRVELVFCSLSTPSIETVRDRQERARKAGAQGPMVLAIIHGEARELAKKIAAENGLSATIVVEDPERNITRAYGVDIRPTTVLIDAFGLVREIHYGRFAGEHLAYPSQEKGAAAR